MAIHGRNFLLSKRNSSAQSVFSSHRFIFKLIPGSCVLCGLPSYREVDLCLGCESRLPLNHQCCPRCASPMHESRLCGHCLATPPNFNRVIAPWLFLPPVSSFVSRFKNNGDYLSGLLLIDALVRAIEMDNIVKPDVMFAVPLHWRKRFTRGFNQAEWIARQLAKRFQWELASGLHKIRYTPSQKQLDSKQRQKNLRNSFAMNMDVSGKHIALVDDVMTTGSTVSEITRLLLRGGAKKVDVFCLARTPLEK